MALWQKLWLLFAVIWGVVAALNVGTILAFSEESEKIFAPALFGIAVPVVVYLITWAVVRLRRKKSGSEPDFPKR